MIGFTVTHKILITNWAEIINLAINQVGIFQFAAEHDNEAREEQLFNVEAGG